MFTFQFYIFGRQATVKRSHAFDPLVTFWMDGFDFAYMSLSEFRSIYGSCSVVGCDHLTLGDYLPLS